MDRLTLIARDEMEETEMGPCNTDYVPWMDWDTWNLVWNRLRRMSQKGKVYLGTRTIAEWFENPKNLVVY